MHVALLLFLRFAAQVVVTAACSSRVALLLFLRFAAPLVVTAACSSRAPSTGTAKVGPAPKAAPSLAAAPKADDLLGCAAPDRSAAPLLLNDVPMTVLCRGLY